MKLSRRRLLGVLGLGLFGGAVVPKIVASEESQVFKHGQMSLYLSQEAYEDIMNWNVDQIDEQTRKEIYNSPGLVRIYG